MSSPSTVNMPPTTARQARLRHSVGKVLTFWTRPTSVKAGSAWRSGHRIVILAAEGYSSAEIRAIQGRPANRSRSTTRACWPFLRAVDRWERTARNAWAPDSDRQPPEIFCCSLTIRTSRSAWLLSKGTRKSLVKRSTSSRCRSSRASSAAAGPSLGRPRLPIRGGGGLSRWPSTTSVPGRLNLQQRVHVEVGQPRARAEDRQFKQHRAADHDSAGLPDQVGGGGTVAATADHVVHDQHAVPAGEGVPVHLQHRFAVLELVRRLERGRRQFALLAHRYEAGPEVVGNRGRQDEAAGLDPDHLVDGASAVVVDDSVHHAREGDVVGEQRRDVFENDPGLGIVRDVANAGAE